MTAEIIQIRDHQSRRQREQAMAALEAQAIEIANISFPSVFSDGIDGMQFGVPNDTAPSEMIPYHAPVDDPA